MLTTLFQQKKPFIGFITAGDGGIDYCVECALALIEGGVDILEIGLPFTDPIGDGFVIQESSKRSLAIGTTPSNVLDIAKKIRQKSDVPLILFSYYNPLLQQGNTYLNEAKSAGFDNVLIVDLSPSDYQTVDYYTFIQSSGLQAILIVAPSTTNNRLKLIANDAKEFIYYACQKGTTGIKNRLPDDFESQIKRIKQASTLPVVGGFGIGDHVSARQVLAHADGFVVGSAFVNLMSQKTDPTLLQQLAKQIDPRA